MKGVETKAIDKLGRALDVPDREVALLAGFERADRTGAADRAGGVDGDRAQRPIARAALTVTARNTSSTVSRNRVAPMLSTSSNEVSGEVPGLLSVASAIGTPAARRPAIGGNSVSRVK